MKIPTIKLIMLCFVLLFFVEGKAQNTGDSIKTKLDSLSISSIPQLNDTINLSLTNISVSDLLSSVSSHIGININVDPITTIVHNNYSKIRAKDLITLLCHEYDLRLEVFGSILSLKKNERLPYTLQLQKNANESINYDMKDAPLPEFAKKLAEATGVNIFIPRQFNTFQLDGYAQQIKVEEALLNIAKSNGFNIQKETPKLFVIEEILLGENATSNGRRTKIENTDGKFVVRQKNASLQNLIIEVAEKTNSYVSFSEEIKEKHDVFLPFTTFEDFLSSILLGTNFTYKKQDSTYFIGSKSKNEMHSHFIYKFQNRKVDSLSYLLPEKMKEFVEIAEYPELNSALFSGDIISLNEMKSLCKQLDQMIPLVLIDVILVETSNSLDISTGITAGLAKSGADVPQTGGTINPELDFTLNGSSINSILRSVGLSNIGTVNANFYMQLKALEKNGMLEVKSTPKLSTLSGNKATLSIGETVYYEEKTLSLYGSLNPGSQEQVIYRPISAKLGVDIRPVVTGDNFVNLDISVIQSSFTERVGKEGTGPPGLVSREFKSMIRVKNGETAILGGLEEARKEKSNSGIPLLSRIPIINFLFSGKSNKKDDKKFTVFISPKIIY